MDDLAKFIKRLTELMEEKDLRVLDLAKKINCSRNAITQWLEVKYFPRCDMLLKLSQYFCVTLDYLLGLSDNREDYKATKDGNFLDMFKLLLLKNNFTEYGVAKVCKFSQINIRNWKKRGSMPDTQTLVSLAKLFDVTVEYLLGRGE